MSIPRLATVLLSSATCACAAPIVFNFATDPAGTSTTFYDNVSGLFAAFSSIRGFEVEPTFFTTLPGHILVDGLEPPPFSWGGTPNPDTNIPLTIEFFTGGEAADLDGISLLFATNGGILQLQAYNGASLVGTVTALGTLQPSGFPEGSISFSGGPFDRVVLSAGNTGKAATAPAFAIDDVAATVVPEPSSLFLIGSGLGLSALIRRWWPPREREPPSVVTPSERSVLQEFRMAVIQY